MSKEISLKDLMPNEFYINDIGIMCCELSLKEVNRITDVLTNLQQENQQLKEELKLVESLASFNMPDNTPMVCMFKADYERNKYEYETLDKYKSVLDEIRGCTKELYEIGVEWHWDNGAMEDYVKEILQILDKVKEC